MSFSFPSNPTVNQTSTQNGRVYTWSGYAWELLGNLSGGGGGSATTNASDLTSGTLNDARLSGNVVLTNDARLSDARTPTTHNHAASDINSGTLDTARLGSGTASSSTYLRGDQTWASIPTEVREYATTTNFPGSGDAAVIYIATDTGRTYRWTGSLYVETGATPTTIAATDPTAGLTILHPFLLGGM